MNCFRHYDVGDMNGEVILFSNWCPYGKKKRRGYYPLPSTSLASKNVQYIQQNLMTFWLRACHHLCFLGVFEVKKYN